MTGHEDDKRDETEGREEPRVHDKRRIDPVTGEPREAAADAAASGAAPSEGAAPEGAASDDMSEADRALLAGEAAAIEAERAALQAKSEQQQDELARLKAEYVNYRSRTERERAGDRDATIASVIASMLPALDDLDLADKHGDLVEGPLAIVAQKLRASFEQLGVVKLGEVGEAFDIDKHEAVAQLPNPEVTEMVVADVVQAGYRVGDRVLRAAKVAVFVPAE
ncbi:nucleotide exchange factor GrpE [Agrococcus sp. Marseille-Q4369]|uniref:nucleotide exchange factor GrpE n=1 Tax=Agrococcus sp. Marseille-Q4369 TaxID=2810513 RepID=UPI001B8C5B3D|nr:nucleotide exchange factor GrpE [Agrococcus sp. Marseille-Q4369]QUW18153.1 nucleotide exchange factor GrpE [Agrococcus sp. Marseille-Q4369]